jgi:hypothetical protein
MILRSLIKSCNAFHSDSVAGAKNALKKGRERATQEAMQQQQAQQEAAAQMQQQQLEAQRQMAIEDREDKQAHEKELKIMEHENKIILKEIDSFKFQRDQDVNNNNVPDQLEIERLRSDERKDLRKNAIEEKKIAQKDRELDIKRKELAKKSREKQSK